MIKFILLFSLCAIAVTKAALPNHCINDNDCKENECCSAYFWRIKICYERGRKGRPCTYGESPMKFQYARCPCQEGLKCEPKGASKRMGLGICTEEKKESSEETDEPFVTEAPEPEIDVTTEQEESKSEEID